jgi:DNA-binding CsgD family transcriptional regulator/PAS domain-containing protein
MGQEMPVSYSAFGIQRWRVLLAVAALVAAIAIIDWRVAQEVSLGFLYFFPIFLAASCLSQWQLAAVAAVCTLLREALGPFESDIPLLGLSRMFLAWGSYTAAGWLVRGILKNFQKVKEQLEEIEARDRLLHDSEEQLRILIETSSAAILTLNLDGEVIQANGAASRLLGQEQSGILGQNVSLYLPALSQVPIEPNAPAFRTTMECTGQRTTGEFFVANVCFSTYVFSGHPRLTAVVTETEGASTGPTVVPSDGIAALTQLESVVLRGIFEGHSNKEIAVDLQVSESSVKSTIQRLFSKMGARTRSQLVRIAFERFGPRLESAETAPNKSKDTGIAGNG